MRTPLAAKLATLGSKPVFREEDEDEEAEEELPPQGDAEPVEDISAPASPERPSTSPATNAISEASVPATPMPSSRQSASRRWIEPMTEEEEEEEEEHFAVDEHGHPIHDSVGYEGNEHLFRPQFQPLTPITEATFEFTRYTNARTPGTATRSAVGPVLKSLRHTEDDEEEEEDAPVAILTAGPIATAAATRPAATHVDGEYSQSPSDERSFASTSGEDGNRSAWTADNKASFELTKVSPSDAPRRKTVTMRTPSSTTKSQKHTDASCTNGSKSRS